jgi:hypothetical protein
LAARPSLHVGSPDLWRTGLVPLPWLGIFSCIRAQALITILSSLVQTGIHNLTFEMASPRSHKCIQKFGRRYFWVTVGRNSTRKAAMLGLFRYERQHVPAPQNRLHASLASTFLRAITACETNDQLRRRRDDGVFLTSRLLVLGALAKGQIFASNHFCESIYPHFVVRMHGTAAVRHPTPNLQDGECVT